MPNLKAFFDWAVVKCNDANVGYSQAYRNQQTVGGITYYDCSSFINYAMLAGGWTTPGYAPDSNSFTTYTMPDALTAAGWKQVSASGIILPGDIGLSDSHTEICHQSGTPGQAYFMGAHTDGVPLADQVSIANYLSSFPQIWRYGEGGLTGTSIYVAAAICGNFWQESGINPGIWEGLQEPVPDNWEIMLRGFGLGQWTNVGSTHGRLYNLHEFQARNGNQTSDGNGQLQFLLDENYWTPQQEAAIFPDLNSFLNTSITDLALLTHAYNIGWEGIHDDSWDIRVTYAQKCFDYISAHYDDQNIRDWIKGNRYLAEEERLNNAVLVYRFLAGGVIPPTPGSGKKGMPVYMMLKKRRYYYGY